jgi:hypothetical protein
MQRYDVMKTLKLSITIVLACLLLPALAHADFWTVDIGGYSNPYTVDASLSYAGASNPLIGSAPVDHVTVSGPNGTASIACISCALSFRSGPNISIRPGISQGGWPYVAGLFESGGEISITGQLAGLGTTSNLFSGFFEQPLNLFESRHYFYTNGMDLPVTMSAPPDVAKALDLPGTSGDGLFWFRMGRGYGSEIFNPDGSFSASGSREADVSFAPRRSRHPCF